jgi:hypothetical protein
MTPRRIAPWPLLVGAALCLPPTLRAQPRERLDTTVTLTRGAVVDLSLISGRISVRGWDRDEARIVAVVDGGELRFDASASSLRLGVRPTGRGWSGGEHRFELAVPRGVRVIAAGTSADIEVQGTEGEVDVRSTSGDILVTGARRRLTVDGTSGDLRIRDAEGDVRLATVSGDVVLDGVAGEVELSTVSGDARLTGGQLGGLRASTVSGAIAVEARLEGTGRYELRAHSGDLRLVLDDRPMVIAAETHSGDIVSRLPATLLPSAEGRRRGQRMELAVGDSSAAGRGARVVATTFSGDIVVERRRP